MIGSIRFYVCMLLNGNTEFRDACVDISALSCWTRPLKIMGVQKYEEYGDKDVEVEGKEEKKTTHTHTLKTCYYVIKK